jgi:putative transposase
MGGSALDNALAESLFATLKCEEARAYPSRDVARRYLFDYLETFYNRRRRHSSLGFLSPASFEELAVQRRLTDCLC